MHTHTSQSTNTSANWAMATQKLASLRKVVSAKLRGRGRRPSLGTRHKYVKAFRRMRTQRKTPKDYIGSKNTFYFMRAAWTWGVLRDMSAEIRSIGRVIRPDNEALVAAAICRAHDLIEDLNRHKPDPGHKNRDNVELVGEFTQLTDGRRQTLASKRRELKSLPLCWRDQTVAAAWLADSSYLLPIATESAVGPRPAELARGVRVSLDEDGNLVFTIAGAKYREGEQGQEWRKITCPVQALDTQIVRDAVIAAGRELLIVAPSAKGMWSAVNYFAKQAFPATTTTLAHTPCATRSAQTSRAKAGRRPPSRWHWAIRPIVRAGSTVGPTLPKGDGTLWWRRRIRYGRRCGTRLSRPAPKLSQALPHKRASNNFRDRPRPIVLFAAFQRTVIEPS